ncbi:hypothetical protein L1887_36737 [Cichorium endivia]|nr:hypothetical protein L1887_36737 [Cichorium endivia]
MKEMASSNVDSIKRHLDFSHSEILKDMEASQSRQIVFNLPLPPLVIAAHPSEADQLALGRSDGGVYAIEPLRSEGKWGTSRPITREFEIASEVVQGGCHYDKITSEDRLND